MSYYMDYELQGGRAPSAWNLYVKNNYHMVKNLPAKERLGALAQMARKEGVVGNGPSKPKKYSSVSYGCRRFATADECNQNSAHCKWAVGKAKTKKGVRKSTCRDRVTNRFM